MLPAKKRFGQHFLHDPTVVARILQALAAKRDDVLVEIGPGRGALTVPLLQRVERLIAVEIDRDLIPPLRTACFDAAALDVRVGDALHFDFAALAPPQRKLRLIGNLPYNISTPLLFHLLAQSEAIEDMLFMLQKEVVDRMTAQAGEKDYGRLSVTLAVRAQVQHLFDVGPGAFSPPPKVQSAVVRLIPRPPLLRVDDPAMFDRLVSAAFGQRRKQLANSLRGLASAAELERFAIDPATRAERLSPADFTRLANGLAREPKAAEAAPALRTHLRL